jgi:hypothetical protein
MLEKILGVLLAVALAGCATPTTQRVAINEESTKSEAAKQAEMAVDDMVAEQKRITRVYRLLATKAHELCGAHVGPNVGFFTMTKPQGETGEVFQKKYGIGERRTVLFVLEGGPAAAAGLRAGDVLKTVNGVSAGDTRAMESLYDTISPDAPITYEVERSGTTAKFEVKPDRACRYPAMLHPQQAINAFADGKSIMIARGMVNFARDDNELALVIAHEMAHNTMRHLDARKQNMGLGLLADIATVVLTRGAVNPNFASLAAGAYSQEFEAEADYVGLYIMANAGLPIEDAPKFWRRMAAAHPSSIRSNHSASHPSTAYRMVALEAAVKEIQSKQTQRVALLPNMRDGKVIINARREEAGAAAAAAAGGN